MESPAALRHQSARPVALVTGGARRLGRVICERLAEAGWSIAVHYRSSESEAQSLVRSLHDQGHSAAAFSLDLDAATPQACQQLLAEIRVSLGPVGLLVHNASRFEYDLPEAFTPESLHRHLQSNLVAPLLMNQALYQDCQANQNAAEGPGPHAVVISLLDQKLANPNPDFFSYTVSKHGLEAASQLMARSFAPQLRVVGLSPGLTLPSADQTDEEFEITHRQTPLGRSSTAQEVADAVAWLADARAVTGTTLLVDGGQHLQPSSRDVMFSTR